MTRNLIATASRTLLMLGSGSARPRRFRANPCVENLEYRISLSSVSAGPAPLIKHAPVPADLNPQPLPPGARDPGPKNII